MYILEQKTYSRFYLPKHSTHIPHATLPLQLLHLHCLCNTLHTPCNVPIPDTIIYHYLYLSYQLQMVQRKYILRLYTRQHIFLLVRTSGSSDDKRSNLGVYPHHPHPYLILTHRSANRPLIIPILHLPPLTSHANVALLYPYHILIV